MANDIPYFEPLLLHLKKDQDLHVYFSDTDFFVKPKVRDDVEQMIKESCPVPRGIIIFPGETRPKNDGQKGCFSPGVHVFEIVVMVQCLDNYLFVKNVDETFTLKGQVILLSEMRKAVKKSVQKFARQIENETLTYNNIKWAGDSIIDVEGKYLATSVAFSIDIY